jgi:hypothetical protein
MCPHLGPVLPIFVQMNIRLAEGDDTWREVARYILTLIRAARAEKIKIGEHLSCIQKDNLNDIPCNIFLGKNLKKT